MPRPARGRLSPWIESLILSYGGQEGSSSSGQLRAHVIGVGQMCQSQVQDSEGPTGLLFLSDGVLQIPAILTASAWERLQEQEDRESFTSLINTTVCIQDYRLQFHMALEQTKCRFLLSIGELATTAAGPVKENTPCSTTLPSIRLMICKTWRALLGQESQVSQESQCGFDLSELLGEWRHDCLQAVLKDVQERLMVASSRPVSQQPSTSTDNSSLTDTFTATSWDVDRVRYKGVKCFRVPIKCLLIPEEDALQLQTPPIVRSRSASGLSASETTQPSADDAEWRIARPAVVERDHDANKNSPSPVEDSVLHEDIIIDNDISPLANPWDIFPPLCMSSSSSDASQEEAIPTQSQHDPTATDFKSVIYTSTQLPVHSSKESHQTPEHSYLPPYQKVPHSSSIPATAGSSTSASVSPPEPFTVPSNLLLATDEHHANTTQQRQILEKDREGTEGEYRKAKRKKSDPTTEALDTLVEEDEEVQISTSPPSWLFDSETGSWASWAEEGSSHTQGQTAGTVVRKNPTVHTDGKPFSYPYQVSGKNLQDFSRFKVTESLLHWAVKYLVVPKTDNPQDTSAGTSNQSKSDRFKM
ncbi:adrenocortical dysplasia protein homolog [Centropristis striata]|uniref:adrenocortical dysplasia protein homolog n=1 Tax=Centropristis striata TaxID=184440 RepID=UPI0027E1BE05|nr:adrenocortical dysplasia protein homolog [Centropristis striata]